MLKMNLTLMIAITILATGCATKADLTDTYAQGWRRAKIIAVDKDQLAVQSEKQDCRTAFAANAVDTKFVLASYSYGGSPNLRAKRIVALPNDAAVNVGDWVFVNITDCKLPLRKLGLRNERP
jgi:hypothetical protein